MSDEVARLRQTLHLQLVSKLAADFEANGAEAVLRLREKDPAGYLRAIAAAAGDTQPLETFWSEFSDGDLDIARAALRQIVGARTVDDGGMGAAPEREQAGPLSPLREAKEVP